MLAFARPKRPIKWSTKWPKHISPANLILAPLKQHLGCCVIVPLSLKLLGGVALVQAFIRDPNVELAVLALFLPVTVYLVLRLEDAWRARHARKHEEAHDPCGDRCDPRSVSFQARYWTNLALAAGLALTLHVLFHHHHG